MKKIQHLDQMCCIHPIKMYKVKSMSSFVHACVNSFQYLIFVDFGRTYPNFFIVISSHKI